MLEVILEDPGGQGGGHTLSLSLPLYFDGADDFSATDDFGGGQAGNFRGKHETDLQLRIRVEQLLRLEEQSGTADVLRGARTPALFSQRTIA